jgi:ubiquitin-protein ligase
VDIYIPSDYPMLPPNMYFATKVFHARVDDKTGNICTSTFRSSRGLTDSLWNIYTMSQKEMTSQWSPAKTLNTCKIGNKMETQS